MLTAIVGFVIMIFAVRVFRAGCNMVMTGLEEIERKEQK